jgi:hypothetical protein
MRCASVTVVERIVRTLFAAEFDKIFMAWYVSAYGKEHS